MPGLGPIELTRCEGDEPFHCAGEPLEFDLATFWQWSFSDVVSNATRGIVAEFIVARALGIGKAGVREEWAAYDLEIPDGPKIEVKSAAYIQSWQQREFSKISFRVPKTLGWDKNSNRQSQTAKRQADVYVFALLAHKNQESLDPLDVSQWMFYVLPTVVLDNRKRSQHSITLPSLEKLAGDGVKFRGLAQAVRDAAQIQKQLPAS
jgi:hypothetical protein